MNKKVIQQLCMLSCYNIGNKSKTYQKRHANDIANKNTFASLHINPNINPNAV